MRIPMIKNLQCNGFFAVSVFLASAIVLLSCGGDRPQQISVIKNKQMQAMVINDDSVMRIDPLLYSGRVGLLRKADIVEILDRSSMKYSVGNMREYWYKIKSRDGLSGWVYGSNLKIFDKKGERNIKQYVSNFWEQESEKIKKIITGRWWSIDLRGDFTNHGLEIAEDGTYRSYYKGGRDIKGEYNINYGDNEIVFLKGTTFKSNLNIVRRGNFIYLEKKGDESEIKFQKTSNSTEEPNVQDGSSLQDATENADK